MHDLVILAAFAAGILTGYLLWGGNMATDQLTAHLLRENRALTARVAELEAALKPFALEAERGRRMLSYRDTHQVHQALSCVGDLRRAAALLSGGGDV